MRENDTSTRISVMDIAVALSLLSRLPVNTIVEIPQSAWAQQARTVWAFPIIGVLVGGIAVAFGWLAGQLGLPNMIVAGIILALMIICTGAMHEDGLADCADGFWGGWTVQRRLEIMKDSHIGTYGILSLILVTGLRWVGYGYLLTQVGLLGIVATAALSRSVIPAAMAALPYARQDGLSRSVGQPSKQSAALCAGLGLAIGIICLGWTGILAAIAASIAMIGVAALAKAKIGGQTGDVLGATQQIAELAVVFVLILR